MNNHTITRIEEQTLPNRTALWFTAGLAFAALLATPPVRAQVTLQINNQSGQPVCVMWTGMTSATGVTTLTGLTSSGANILPSDAGPSPPLGYPLSAFSPVTAGNPNLVQIPNFTMGGGRMWFTYGNNCWTIHEHRLHAEPRELQRPQFHAALRQDRGVHHGQHRRQPRHHGGRRVRIPFSVKAYASAIPSTTTQTLRGSAGNSVIAALGAIAANASAPAPTAPGGRRSACRRSPATVPISSSTPTRRAQTTAAPYTDSPYRQQRHLRAHHRQRQPDRHVSRATSCRRPVRIRGPGQLQLGDLQQLRQAHGRPGRISLHGHHQHRREVSRESCRPGS